MHLLAAWNYTSNSVRQKYMHQQALTDIEELIKGSTNLKLILQAQR
jgi:hypothetical protein